jgi:hypothetical protein
MAEQKQGHKRARAVRQILKWLGVGFLGILLALALIFQAPWKITILLAVFLAACTVLPRPARKWFWLSAGTVVLVLIIWVFLPDDNEGWRPYTFDEELAALEAKYTIPDEENAAVIYNELLKDYDPNTMRPDFLDPQLEKQTRSEPWATKDYPQVANWLQKHQYTITRLAEATRKNKCHFSISPLSLTDRTSRHAAVKQWAFLLVRAANNDLAENRIQPAIEKLVTLSKMAQHHYQQPTTLDKTLGIALEALALSNFKKFTLEGNGGEQDLRAIESAMSEIKHDWASDIREIVEDERIKTKNFLCGMIYQVNPRGKTRLSRGPTAVLADVFKGTEVPPKQPPTGWMKVHKVGIILGWFFLPATPQKAGGIIDNAFKKSRLMAESDFNWQRESKTISAIPIRLNCRYYLTKQAATLSEKPFERTHTLYLRVVRDNRGSQILIGLRRCKTKYGSWPETLNDVKPFASPEVFIDPTNAGPFVYKVSGQDFILYSRGENNIDENGEYRAQYRDGADDWFIWPPRR